MFPTYERYLRHKVLWFPSGNVCSLSTHPPCILRVTRSVPIITIHTTFSPNEWMVLWSISLCFFSRCLIGLKGTETNFLICNICALWQILTSLLLSQCWRGGSKVSSFSIPSVSQPFWPPTNRMQFQWTQKTLFQFRDFCTFLRHLLSRQRWINFSR